jgi:transposase InsO family protein
VRTPAIIFKRVLFQLPFFCPYFEWGFLLLIVSHVSSRKCIGWKLGRDIDAKLALPALDMALADRKDMGISILIHHSDQGVQHASLSRNHLTILAHV